MTYDFTTATDRRGTGSMKWELMYRKWRECCGGTAAEAEEALAGIVPLTVADMEFVHPPELVEGMRDFFGRAVLGYTGPTDSYYEALLGWMEARHGWRAQAEWAVQTPGVVTALHAAALAFTEPGDGIIVQSPVYPPFYKAAALGNRRLVENPLTLDEAASGGDRRYSIDFDHLETLVRQPANKMLLLCSPHNPTGRVWTRGELEKIAALCLEHGVLVVSDEIHFDLILQGPHTVFAALGREAAMNSVVCTAATKTFNLAGLQCSNIFIADAEKRERFKAVLGTLSLHEVNAATLAACEIAYRRLGPWLDELLQAVAANHKLAADFTAAKLPAIKAHPVEGTYLQWLDCRGLGMDHKEIEPFLIRKAKFFSNDGAMFGRAGRGFQRVNLACPTTVLEQALVRLEKAGMTA